MMQLESELRREKSGLSLGFPSRSDTNRHVQSQKQASTILGEKTKALISCAVTAQLICVFVFAYAKI